MLRTALLVVLVLASIAHAEPANRVALRGADSRALTLGMKLAGIPLARHNGILVYAVTNVTCTTVDGGVTEDGLDVASCQIGTGKAMGATESALLADAITGTMSAKGLPTDTHMSKTTITVASIECLIGPDSRSPKSVDRFTCEAGLRQSLLITPKKVKVKDIVQPVKIQKQDVDSPY